MTWFGKLPKNCENQVMKGNRFFLYLNRWLTLLWHCWWQGDSLIEDEYTACVIYAIYYGDTELLQEILDNYGDYEDMNSRIPYIGVGFLHYCIAFERFDMAQVLLKSGAKIDLRIKEDLLIWRQVDTMTPLQYAAIFGHKHFVRLFLEHGADASLRTFRGDTALDVAKTEGNEEAIKLLEEHMGLTKKEAVTMEGVTPMKCYVLKVENEMVNSSSSMAYKWKLSVETETINGNPTEKELDELSQKLGFEWTRLATHLGVKHAKIQQIEMNYQGNVQRQIFEMLIHWRKRAEKTNENDRYKELKIALKKIAKNDLANSIAKVISIAS